MRAEVELLREEPGGCEGRDVSNPPQCGGSSQQQPAQTVLSVASPSSCPSHSYFPVRTSSDFSSALDPVNHSPQQLFVFFLT